MKSKTQLTIFLGLMIALCIAGCAGNVKTEVRTEVLAPPSTLLMDVAPEKPPVISEYVGLRYFNKEEILIDKFRAQTQNLEACNSQLKSVRDWVTDTTRLYAPKE